MTFCHFLDTQEAVLGDCNFGGANGHQIEKFHLGWRVEIQKFPTSPRFPHLDAGKCLKSGLKGALRVEKWRATRQGNLPVFHLQLRKTQHLTSFDFLVGFFILLDVIDVILC